MRPLISILNVIIIVLFLAGCKSGVEREKTNHVVHVKTMKPRTEQVAFPIQAAGKLTTDEEVKLSFKTGGILDQYLVKEGTIVQKGRLLAKLEMEEINAGLQKAKAAMDKAKRDFERGRKLFKDSVITLEQFQNLQTALEVAKSDFEMASFNRKYSEIRAPSTGKILKKLSEEKEMCAPGYPVILFGNIRDQWVATVNLSDRDIVKIDVGDSAFLSLDVYPGIQFGGRVHEIASYADPYTGTFEVKILMYPVKEKLIAGFTAKVNIVPTQKDTLTALPVEAMFEAEERTGHIHVFDHGKVKTQDIDIFKIKDEMVYTKTKIDSDIRVIIENIQNLDHSKIKPE